jgi:hypothetical protein
VQKRLSRIALWGLLLAASPAAAQEPQLRWPDSPAREPVVMLGHKGISALVPLDLVGNVTVFEPVSFEKWLGNWGKSVTLRLAAAEEDTVSPALPDSKSPTEFLPPLPVKLTKAAGDTARGPDGILSQYGDLGMQVVGRGEMGGAWTRPAIPVSS